MDKEIEMKENGFTMDFSIVLPVYNQADHIVKVVEDYIQEAEKHKFSIEFILVVNNSNDGSIDNCLRLAEKYDYVFTEILERGGWGRAIKHGIKIARGNAICYTNSARTSTQDLVLMLLYATANSEMVIKANRKIRDNLFRRLGSLLYNLECRMLFDIPYWDINGTPKVFPREFTKLLELTRDDDLIDLEFLVVSKKNAYPLLEVPVLSQKRHGGRSTTKVKSALKMYFGALKMRFSLGKSVW